MPENLELSDYEELKEDKTSYFRDRGKEILKGGIKAVKTEGEKVYSYIKEKTTPVPLSDEQKKDIKRRNKEIQEAQHKRKVRTINETPIDYSTPKKSSIRLLRNLGKTNPMSTYGNMGLGTGRTDTLGSMNMSSDFFSIPSKSVSIPVRTKHTQKLQPKVDLIGSFGHVSNPLGYSKPTKTKKGKKSKQGSGLGVEEYGGI